MFGKYAPVTKHSNFSRIKAGDNLQVETNVVMVLQKNGNTLTVVEGNYNATVHWGRKITKKGERSMITKNDRNTLTQIVKAFCSAVEAAGYWVGIYSSESFFNSEMNDGELIRYSHWVARWGKSKPAPASGAETQIWQFGGETNLIRSNKINGQSCDQDYCYVDFPAKIKAAGLNGYAKGSSTPAPVKKSNEEIASEVIAGKWGNGAERQKLLSQAGYDYSAVQSIVNKKLSPSRKSVDEIAREVIHGDLGKCFFIHDTLDCRIVIPRL